MDSCSREGKDEKVESIEGPNWLELPRELTTNILHRLDTFAILTSARQVCSLWWNICKDPLMWRTIDLTNNFHYPQSKSVKLCRYAIEKSCGHMEDISIEYFATGKVLKYIADSGSNLRKMRLLKCWAISNEELSKYIMKLPLLEEFEISLNNVSMDTFEVMGKCCPLLKVLKYNMRPFISFPPDNEAFAIANTMPELRHLQLMGNWLTNYGLLAIIDGCPHLESLDLRGCWNVDLSGSLGERCHRQIKDFKS